MSRRNDKAAFEAAIAKDRYDQVTRLIFADWCDENGFDDEAAVQRAWTREKQEAEDWLRDFAKRLNANETYGRYREEDEQPDPQDLVPYLSYEGLLEAVRNYVNNGNAVCLPFDTPEVVFEERENFWKNMSIVTGQSVTEEQQADVIFRCAC